jgi:hypothetical protein
VQIISLSAGDMSAAKNGDKMMNAPFRLSADQRATVRKALTSNPGWPAYRQERRFRIELMNAENLVSVCNDLSIDLSAVISQDSTVSYVSESTLEESTVSVQIETKPVESKPVQAKPSQARRPCQRLTC